MPSFDAGSVADPLHVKLKPHADFDDTITEPTDEMIGAFMAGVKNLFADAGEALGLSGNVGPDSSPDELQAAFGDLDPDSFVQVMKDMAALHSALCSGRPTTEQLLALPLRKRLLFYGWLQSEVMSPEAETPAGNGQGQIRQLRRGA